MLKGLVLIGARGLDIQGLIVSSRGTAAIFPAFSYEKSISDPYIQASVILLR